MAYTGTFGMHFPIHQPGWVDLSAPAYVDLAGQAEAAGFETVWVNDNFKARHTFSLLAAIAARHEVGLGTLVTYPYARNPMDLATALGTVAELSGTREVRVGISTGARAIQGPLVDRPSRETAVREAMDIGRRLFAGEDVAFRDFPVLSTYYHIKPAAHLRIQFRPARPLSFWIPPKGPRMLRLAAEHADGVIFNTYTQYAARPFLRDGTLERTVEEMERVRRSAGNTTPLRKIFKLDMSLAADRTAARRFARNFVSFNAAGDADRYIGVGFAAEPLLTLRERYRAGASIEECAELVSDELLDWITLAGAPDDVAEGFAEYLAVAERLDFEQVIVAVPVGPDPAEAIELARTKLLPRVLSGTAR
jgi:alkanesulfonate monooxygenase SsuD/methylene tetrahydromethanopterin reductase-like flavin-dependent oxidoreductase (luciferase family)